MDPDIVGSLVVIVYHTSSTKSIDCIKKSFEIFKRRVWLAFGVFIGFTNEEYLIASWDL